jgi:hypothetical protein
MHDGCQSLTALGKSLLSLKINDLITSCLCLSNGHNMKLRISGERYPENGTLLPFFGDCIE